MPTVRRGTPPRTAAALLRGIRLRIRLRRYLISLAMVGGAAAVAELIYRTLHTDRVSMIFLAPVLVSAAAFGAESAIFAALAAFLYYNFYLVEPRFTIHFASAEDYFVLAAFLSVALLTGGLTGRLKDEHQRSRSRAARLALLFDASREMSSTEGEALLRQRLAHYLAAALQAKAWVFAPDEPVAPEAWADLAGAEQEALRMLVAAPDGRFASAEVMVQGDWRVRPLVSDGAPLGVAVWRLPETETGTADELDRLARVLADVGAGALARARMSAQRAEVESAARTERLRTALLSSMSHDFRTPLAAILASATSLIDFEDSLEPPVRRDLLQTIQDEGERLNRFVANLLNMTKLESDALTLQVQTVPVVEVARRAANRLARRAGARTMRVETQGERLNARADPVLLESVLTNLIENAIAFSPDDSEIRVRVEGDAERVRLEVADQGPGIPASEAHRIFDKFFRANNARQSAQGTGLGLSICKGLVEAMAGSIAVQPRADARRGLSVVVTLPGAG